MRNIILLSIVIAITAAFFASTHPDGLEKVAQNLGFIENGVERISLMTDYAVPFIANEAISTSLAGILGIIITFGSFWALAAALKKRKEVCPFQPERGSSQ